MANRRGIKKEITFIASELIAECLFNQINQNDEMCAKLDVIIDKVIDIETDFKARVNVADGKENPKLVKKYFAHLIADLDKAIDEVVAEMTQLLGAE